MELVDVLARGGAGRVIVVDDFYARPDLTAVDAESLTTLYGHLDRIEVDREAVRTLLGLAADMKLDKIMEAVEENLSALWDAYQAGQPHRDALAPLFATIEFSRAGSIAALDTIVNYCRINLRTEPLMFGSMGDASTALRNCAVAFVDFRFHALATVDQAIDEHSKYSMDYRFRHTFEGEACPKVVYLISTGIPPTDKLQAFRSATGLRSAFFTPLRKSDVTPDVLDREFGRWRSRYSAAGSLDAYLSAMSTAVRANAEKLCEQLDQIELHDLSLLRVFKLAAERESLQSYLTWLLSEAMASKLRLDPELQKSLVSEATLPPLDGKLKLGALLFDLFSQIAIIPVEPNSTTPAFGDIYALMPSGPPAARTADVGADEAQPKAEHEEATPSRQLLLAITPACDLVRCVPEDVVLCLAGTERHAKPDMEELLKQGVLFGQGRHVIQYTQGSAKAYAYIAWGERAFRTVVVRDLSNIAKYQRVARLSELFAQEIKEWALSNASRVGIPVYPPFTVSARVLVRSRFANISHERDLTGVGFESAIVIRGRTLEENREHTILGFTEQFADWIRATYLTEARQKLSGKESTQLNAVEQYFQNWNEYSIELGGSQVKSINNVTFRYVQEVEAGEASANKLEILVYAAGLE